MKNWISKKRKKNQKNSRTWEKRLERKSWRKSFYSIFGDTLFLQSLLLFIYPSISLAQHQKIHLPLLPPLTVSLTITTNSSPKMFTRVLLVVHLLDQCYWALIQCISLLVMWASFTSPRKLMGMSRTISLDLKPWNTAEDNALVKTSASWSVEETWKT